MTERAGTYDLYQQGRERLEQGQPAAAAEVLELAVEQEPSKASLREALARAYFATGRVSGAREQFERALEIDPSDDYAHFGVGRCYERQGRYSGAARHYKLAYALSPRADYAEALERIAKRV